MRVFKNLLPLVALLTIVACGGGGEKPLGPITPANVAVTAVTISATSGEIVIGNTIQLSVTISPSNATDKTVAWSSSNASVATVSSTGLVTAHKEGIVNITAFCGGKSATCKITVKKKAVASIKLSHTSLSLIKGDSQTITATITPADATNKDITWASSNSSVAIVDNGAISAVGGGTATITATCNGKSATCKVTVTVPVVSISLNLTSAKMVVGGEPLTLVAIVNPDDATDKKVSWSTSNSGVLSVTQEGKITPKTAGTATITATCGGKSATCTITVTNDSGSIGDRDDEDFE